MTAWLKDAAVIEAMEIITEFLHISAQTNKTENAEWDECVTRARAWLAAAQEAQCVSEKK